jgi:UDPglucose 6-dehydrogenase
MDRAREILPAKVEFVADPYEAAADADALLLLTEWEEFATLDLPRVRAQLKYPIIIDGRNLYHPDTMKAHGFTYYSVGRQTTVSEQVNAAPAAAKSIKLKNA